MSDPCGKRNMGEKDEREIRLSSLMTTCQIRATELRFGTYEAAVHGGRLKGPPGALWKANICFFTLSFKHFHPCALTGCGHDVAKKSGGENEGRIYLLVEQSPEHGQGDVEEEHPEDHLHLRDQEFLDPAAGGKLVEKFHG